MSVAVNTSDMFNYCSSVTELDVSGFRTSSLEDMSYMFSSINVPHLDLSNSTFLCDQYERDVLLLQNGLARIVRDSCTESHQCVHDVLSDQYKSITIKDLECHEGCSFSNMFSQSTAEK